MEEIWIFVASLVLASLVLGGMIGAILALVKEKRDKTWKEKLTTQTTTPPPPQLPPRRNTPTASQSLNEASPSRSSSASAIAEANRRAAEGLGSGPRGVLPHQFPCCPVCRQRNILGAPQKIFWDDDEEVYRCSREHRFQKNGKPL